ncbi:PD-(D/E)XK nuclease family protein [Clostridium aestuarii]|uniref:PD-(D/E)XK nuclease family protein n=1 Tax=Clostridium aestuarii TaxID=338193 RepID=A0ABT4CY15_9CLOT|nr:PD-(D/E)XK nuclease family protein [Clostridium aestuarii]MCY6483856.1 PD-(D/E)XK nuclease family protein [Clostridium aestuarii]
MSFFDSIGLADMEKIHSQTIAWLFSKDCDAMSEKEKLAALSAIISRKEIGEIFNVYTEYKNIDIVIETDNKVIAIENKVKSNQHSNQLERYKEILNEDFKTKDKVYIFLTLIPEKAESKGWENTSYELLVEALENQIIKEIETKTVDRVIASEYIITVKRMVEVVKSFESDHRKFKNVFTDGTLKKFEKEKKKKEENYSKNQIYILNNQLETILQKRFFNKILCEFKKREIIQGSVSETRGNALIHISLEKRLEYNGHFFEVGYQIQNNTIKFIFQAETESYYKSKKEWLTEDVIDKMEKLKQHMEYKKLNKPTKHAYISISKKLDINIWEYDFNELIDALYSEYKKAGIHKEKLISSIIQ